MQHTPALVCHPMRAPPPRRPQPCRRHRGTHTDQPQPEPYPYLPIPTLTYPDPRLATALTPKPYPKFGYSPLWRSRLGALRPLTPRRPGSVVLTLTPTLTDPDLDASPDPSPRDLTTGGFSLWGACVRSRRPLPSRRPRPCRRPRGTRCGDQARSDAYTPRRGAHGVFLKNRGLLLRRVRVTRWSVRKKKLKR